MTLSKRKCLSNKPLVLKIILFLDHVFKLKKVLYGLKKTPRAWYDKLRFFLLENSFVRDNVDTTHFRKKVGKDFSIIQIYVNAIIFWATNVSLCKAFFDLMKSEFEMSMMGELKCDCICCMKVLMMPKIEEIQSLLQVQVKIMISRERIHDWSIIC